MNLWLIWLGLGVQGVPTRKVTKKNRQGRRMIRRKGLILEVIVEEFLTIVIIWWRKIRSRMIRLVPMPERLLVKRIVRKKTVVRSE